VCNENDGNIELEEDDDIEEQDLMDSVESVDRDNEPQFSSLSITGLDPFKPTSQTSFSRTDDEQEDTDDSPPSNGSNLPAYPIPDSPLTQVLALSFIIFKHCY
jgi:hypothetical protein